MTPVSQPVGGKTAELPRYVLASQYPHEYTIIVDEVTIAVGGACGLSEEQARVLGEVVEEAVKSEEVRAAMEKANFSFIVAAGLCEEDRGADPAILNDHSGMRRAKKVDLTDMYGETEAKKVAIAFYLHELARVVLRAENGG